jgi:lysophospholipase L1-like esterase
LNYQQWLTILKQEAGAIADQKPEHLAILLGDSLSLWFPKENLPSHYIWLNQGISGETSTGLMHRLDIFDATDPEVIFILIGINDLIRGVQPATVLANQQEIVRELKVQHPNAKIVVQSILPHAGENATWEGRDRLLAISKTTIQDLNAQLAIMADQEGVYYLDLTSLFADENGYLRSELTTDGLHLNPEGYLVWQTALEMYRQLKLEP